MQKLFRCRPRGLGCARVIECELMYAALEAVTQGTLHLVGAAVPAQLQHLHVLLGGASNARARKALAQLKTTHESEFRFKGKV